jgi:hypothetical protein
MLSWYKIAVVMKPKLELIEAILLVYIKSEIKNVIIQHKDHAGTAIESCKEYTVFNKTLKEKDILKYISTNNMYEAISAGLNEFNWTEIRLIFLQYKLDNGSNLKLKLRPLSDNVSQASSEWQVYGRNIPFFTFTASMNKDEFIQTFEKQLVQFLN